MLHLKNDTFVCWWPPLLIDIFVLLSCTPATSSVRVLCNQYKLFNKTYKQAVHRHGNSAKGILFLMVPQSPQRTKLSQCAWKKLWFHLYVINLPFGFVVRHCLTEAACTEETASIETPYLMGQLIRQPHIVRQRHHVRQPHLIKQPLTVRQPQSVNAASTCNVASTWEAT